MTATNELIPQPKIPVNSDYLAWRERDHDKRWLDYWAIRACNHAQRLYFHADLYTRRSFDQCVENFLDTADEAHFKIQMPSVPRDWGKASTLYDRVRAEYGDAVLDYQKDYCNDRDECCNWRDTKGKAVKCMVAFLRWRHCYQIMRERKREREQLLTLRRQSWRRRQNPTT